MIQAEAVEAAAKAEYENEFLLLEGAWADATSEVQALFRQSARVALEAAAPYMMAAAWEAGAHEAWSQSGEGWNAEYPDESTGKCSVDLSKNPYRTE